jgi:SAM-dependent methyltransferase
MRQIEECLVCGRSDLHRLYENTYHGGVDDAHKYFLASRATSAHGEIQKCKNCGFAFTSPQFTPAEYDAIYRRVGEETGLAAAGGPGELATERRFSRLRDRISKHASFDQPFLDFGCGDGVFLRMVGSSSGLGFELGAPGLKDGPGGSKILGGHWPDIVESAAVPPESQAFVTAFDVFEHLPDIERDLSLIRRVLRPGGHLFVTVPDISSLMARASGKKWNMLLLEHLWYFDGATLDQLLKRFGFSPIFRETVPYDASVGHAAKRFSQSIGIPVPRLPSSLNQLVVPVPAGVLFAGYRAGDKP